MSEKKAEGSRAPRERGVVEGGEGSVEEGGSGISVGEGGVGVRVGADSKEGDGRVGNGEGGGGVSTGHGRARAKMLPIFLDTVASAQVFLNFGFDARPPILIRILFIFAVISRHRIRTPHHVPVSNVKDMMNVKILFKKDKMAIKL